ncbi:tail completion protein gp17 [Sphingomonas phyllosphaerae]|uniref:tail completion protein gp17 n=1 Tax=Sphingomonas phyllosphaerae TaxID=257003 RepID=UPI002FFB5F24
MVAALMRAAVLAQLRERVAVTRVFESAAEKGTVPFLTLREWSESDWGTKDRAGRELRIGVAVRDAGESGARAVALAAEAQAALLSLPGVAGWRVVTAVPVRSVLVSESAGRWTALVDVRVRIMAED